ncbi:MAG: hypothetical protein OXH05_02580 [Acidobacteria bacterium]|nr:hypothetical protein [Acidobacteriota bacterium]
MCRNPALRPQSGPPFRTAAATLRLLLPVLLAAIALALSALFSCQTPAVPRPSPV